MSTTTNSAGSCLGGQIDPLVARFHRTPFPA